MFSRSMAEFFHGNEPSANKDRWGRPRFASKTKTIWQFMKRHEIADKFHLLQYMVSASKIKIERGKMLTVMLYPLVRGLNMVFLVISGSGLGCRIEDCDGSGPREPNAVAVVNLAYRLRHLVRLLWRHVQSILHVKIEGCDKIRNIERTEMGSARSAREEDKYTNTVSLSAVVEVRS